MLKSEAADPISNSETVFTVDLTPDEGKQVERRCRDLGITPEQYMKALATAAVVDKGG